MIKVYYGLVTDSIRAETIRTDHMGTKDWVESLKGGRIIPESVTEVDESDVDSNGRYSPAVERGEPQGPQR
jgi:hypothetical protein